jgi:decaprenylphospho-beta-D-ribofuranose 2-oxidase
VRDYGGSAAGPGHIPGKMQVRSFQDSDEAAVIRLWERCGLLRPWNDASKDIARKLRVQPDLFLVGTIDGVVVASVMAGYDGHRGWINYLAVDPDRRRRGLASLLMAEAQRRLADLGCAKINLQIRRDNRHAIGFYEKVGFAEDAVVSLGKRLVVDDGGAHGKTRDPDDDPTGGADGATSAPALTRLSGWGANLRADCVLVEPETPVEVATRLDRAGTIARGLGRSYGDAAINAGRQVLGLGKVDRYLGFDAHTGALTCEAGLSLARIIEDFAPRGWFPMVTPGTKFVTVGGCIANDVHGKAHHAQGCFSACVEALTVLLASGEVVPASRSENSDLFWGTFGGMGLLGVVLSATIRLRRIETTYFRQRSIPVNDLEAMLAALDEHDRTFPYSVATLDVMATGARLGRGVVTVGDHARRDELPRHLAAHPLRVSGPPRLTIPFDLPALTLNPLSIRLVNALIQRVLTRAAPLGHYEGFFYPLDSVAHWNRGYGRRGFTQYQFVIPFADGPRRMREILSIILSAGELPFLNVLKRLGKESGGLLSFPREGYTLAIDLPIRRNTIALLRRLDAIVVEAGGRIYLGKDSYVEAATFRAMYPQLDLWLETKAKYDPHGVFTSDLGRRVGLVQPARSLLKAAGGVR